MSGKREKSSIFNFQSSKLENFLLALFLLLIPTQLGKHFWPSWSLVMGVRVDYLSPTLYLMDIVWVLWMGIKIIRNYELEIRKWKENFFNFQNILVILFVVINILVAGNRGVAIYRWVRMGQWWITYINFKHSPKGTSIRAQTSNIKTKLNWIIPCWIIGETLLGIAQITRGESLQGIWYWLGERRFSYAGIGVAQISWLGQGLVRAYGTFSHPNSLAGFLLISMLYWNGNQTLNIKHQTSKIWYWVIIWMGVAGIIISGSRVVWTLAIILPIISNPPAGRAGFKFLISNYKKYLGMVIVVLGFILIILSVIDINYRISDFVGGWDSDSASKRIALNLAAMKMWKENFILGVGLGNFTSKLPQYTNNSPFFWWQPVHNVFLLWGAETGILGVIGLVWIGANWWRKRFWLEYKYIWVALIVTGLLDHYWLTLPQNSWLVVILLAII